jgi:poly(A)-specific ribonuclease
MTSKCSLTSVHRENFDKLLPDVLRAIDEAAFCTVDTELTGLQASRHGKYNSFDDLSTRYAKLKESASNFAILQVGLGCFSPIKGREDGHEKWTAKCFSFYVFPGGIVGTSSVQNERRFLVQSSALNFLAANGYDFNKSFLKGIPYLNGWEEGRARAGLENREAKKSKHDLIDIRQEADIAFVRDTFDLIARWMEDPKVVDTLELAPCNSYQRLLVYQQCEVRYGDAVKVIKRQMDGKTFLQLAKVVAGTLSLIEEADVEERRRQLEHDLGFRNVWKHLVASKKPVGGHNCFLDFCHLWAKFEDANLPTTLVEFKRAVLGLFPVVLDTKHLASSLCQLSLSLGELYDHFFLPDQREPSEGGEGEGRKRRARHLLHGPLKQAKLHDAGYDAYCTGCVLLATLVSSGHSLHSLNQLTEGNRLYVMQSPYEHVNLSRDEDPEPDWSCVCVLLDPVDNANSGELTKMVERRPSREGVKELIGRMGWRVTAYTRNTDHSYFLTFADAVSAREAVGVHASSTASAPADSANQQEQAGAGMQLMPLDEYRRLFGFVSSLDKPHHPTTS